MSERSIQIDGVTYLRSRDAARIVNLAPDYISRLARSGDIDGRRIENLWFVNLNSMMLGTHRPGVTRAILALEREGLIDARRRNITILNRKNLEKRANGAYVRAEC